jgi:hypothetical protein
MPESKKRPRGYSSDSERDQIEVESVDSGEEDSGLNPREKLRDACSSLGGAPTHPGCLDEKCRLQYGISSNEALDIARTALKALSGLPAAAFNHGSAGSRGQSLQATEYHV